MSEIELYHGSTEIIKKPVFGAGKTYNDYGQGFYCTEHIELAKEWASNGEIDGYSNHYHIDISGLKILNLSADEYNVLNWLAILMDNRIVRLSSPVEKKGRDYLLDNFLIDYSKYDIIKGYRADDSYFSFVRTFLSNTISLKQLEYAMRLGKLGEQVVLKSKKAFSHIEYIDREMVDGSEYYIKRKARDDRAREQFYKELENEDLTGIFIRDIIREGMKSDDERLR